MVHSQGHNGYLESFNDKYSARDRRARRGRMVSYVLLGLLATATMIVVYLALTK